MDGANKRCEPRQKIDKQKAPIAMSKIAVPIIACAKGTGRSPAAQGCRYPPQASGFLKIKTPIHKKVTANPIRKI